MDPEESPERQKSESAETGGTHQSILMCRAPHPRGLRGDGRFEGRLCGKRLQVVPFHVRPTYRTIRDWNDVHAGCIAVRCIASDCRAFTEYEVTDSETELKESKDR